MMPTDYANRESEIINNQSINLTDKIIRLAELAQNETKTNPVNYASKALQAKLLFEFSLGKLSMECPKMTREIRETALEVFIKHLDI